MDALDSAIAAFLFESAAFCSALATLSFWVRTDVLLSGEMACFSDLFRVDFDELALETVAILP